MWAAGREVSLLRIGHKVFATDGVCSHMQANLTAGTANLPAAWRTIRHAHRGWPSRCPLTRPLPCFPPPCTTCACAWIHQCCDAVGRAPAAPRGEPGGLSEMRARSACTAPRRTPPADSIFGPSQTANPTRDLSRGARVGAPAPQREPPRRPAPPAAPPCTPDAARRPPARSSPIPQPRPRRRRLRRRQSADGS